LIILIIAVGLMLFNYGRIYYEQYQITKQINSLQQQANSLQTKKLHLLSLLKYVSSSSFVEDQARIELNMKKKGEHVAVVANTSSFGAEQTNQATIIHTVTTTQTSTLPNIVKWWYYIYHITHR